MGNKSNHNKNHNEKQKTKKNENNETYDYSYYRNIYPPSIMDYKYSKRRVEYYTEKMEISIEEQNLISSIKPEKIDFYEFPPNDEKITKVIIDTDIGTDWDDAMAFSYALKIQNLEILGITTNYGIPDLRAGLAKKIIDTYLKSHPEKTPIPIISGASLPLGTHRKLIIFGNEGIPFYGKDDFKNQLKMEYIINRDQEKAADFIASTVKKYPGEVKIISIGIPTNIGLALNKYKDIIPLIKEIVIMGCGNFIKNNHKVKDDECEKIINEIKDGNNINLFPNHNISGDTLATKIIFDSGVKVKIVSHLVTSKYWAQGEIIDYFKEKSKNITDLNEINDPDTVIGLLMKEWFNIRYRDGQCPHDPLTIHEALYGGDQSPLIYLRGKIIIHEWAAFSTFIPQQNGPHFLSVKIKNNDNFMEMLTKTIMNH